MLDPMDVSSDELLGSGGESQVYALDDTRILRLYHNHLPEDYLQQRHTFYAQLHAHHPPFEIPQIIDAGHINGRFYTLERRMNGRDFKSVLPTLTGPARTKALASFLQVAQLIGTIQFPDHPFGELLAMGEPLRCDRWPQFLWDRMQQTLYDSRADVEQDIPHFTSVLELVQEELHFFAGFTDKCLVHGDYFPGNVFIDDDLNICGVGDFGYTTLIGDPRMDVAGAIVFLELTEPYRLDDTALLLDLVTEHYGPEITRVIHFYRLYYSIYFSYCKDSDRKTYDWCVSNLTAYSRGMNY